MKLFTRADGILALKPDRQALCIASGVTVLGFGEQVPEGGILIADARPRGFVGGRGPNDPAAAMIYIGSPFKPEKTFYFERFDSALRKALKLAADKYQPTEGR